MLAIDFFRFCLQAPSQSSYRNKVFPHWVDLFVKYPEIAQRLMRSSLYEKLGRFPENVYVDDEKGVCLKVDLFNEPSGFLHITAEGYRTFRNKALGGNTQGITLTIDQIFQQFEGPASPDIDISSDGIINFNPLLLESRITEDKAHRIDDPQNWTEYMPFAELDWPDMKQLFPEAKEETPYTFVLRVNSSTASGSHTFFDFIVKSNGKYRVFCLQGHQKPSSGVQHQKSYFYPLTLKQGEKVIEKVGNEIHRFREVRDAGKPIPPIDVQSYLDEILGYEFYDYLHRLVSHSDLEYTEKELVKLNAQFREARKNLDTAALKKFLRPVIVKLMSKRNMELIHQFITASLSTIHTVLHAAAKTDLPVEQEVIEAGKGDYDKMGESLLELAALCFDVLHPYRVSVAEAEKNTPVIGFIFRRIESIPWVWLKNLLYDFFL